MSQEPDRLPPQSREAERSVLGSMLRDNGVIGDVVQIIQPESFYADAHIKSCERIDKRSENSHLMYSGISTGYLDLNEKTAGLQNSELIIIAARPSVGKTAFALNMARHMVVDESLPVFFVSLEQSRLELAERLL